MSDKLNEQQEQIAKLLMQAIKIDAVEACRLMLAMPFSAARTISDKTNAIDTINELKKIAEHHYFIACIKVDEEGEAA